MATVLIVAYMLIVLAMIAVILLQRSEGGGLGMGSSSTGLLTVRGTANLLTRTTAILAVLFFATAIGLTILAQTDRTTDTILQKATQGSGDNTTQPTTVLDALKQLQQQQSGQPATTDTTTAPATTDTTATPATTDNTTAPAADQAAPAAGSSSPDTAAPANDNGTATSTAPSTSTTTGNSAPSSTAPAADPGLPVPQPAAPADGQTQAPSQ